MSKSVKASLLSALVFPGSGHFFLKKPILGAILLTVTIVCLYFLLATVMEAAQGISIKIQTGEIPLNANKIAEAVSNELTGKVGSVNIPSYLFGICWLVGVIDSFRVGRLQDKAGDTR